VRGQLLRCFHLTFTLASIIFCQWYHARYQDSGTSVPGVYHILNRLPLRAKMISATCTTGKLVLYFANTDAFRALKMSVRADGVSVIDYDVGEVA
jgi:hypothetical protein